jgi:hypothetical protein
MMCEGQCRLNALEMRRNSHLSKIKISQKPNGGKFSSYAQNGSGNKKSVTLLLGSINSLIHSLDVAKRFLRK